MLAITTYATKNYTYAFAEQIPLVIAAMRYAKVSGAAVHFIMAGDDSVELANAAAHYERAMRQVSAKFTRLILPVTDNANGRHQEASNLQIASMQEAAWDEARRWGEELCWSLESDILPQPKVLRCMKDALAFDCGWYDVAMATYPNSGFLGGRATPQRHILPNVYPDERTLSDEVTARIKAKEAREKELREARTQPTPTDLTEWKSLDDAVEACPPKGNVMELNGKQWRQRGWLDYAYPAIGRGAILPTDWVGVGCTLMSRRALDLACFTGYEGKGTQDLWLCWRCWHPSALRLAVVTHALCSHVKRNPATGEFHMMTARHELGGPHDGHLRTESRPWGPTLRALALAQADAPGAEAAGAAADTLALAPPKKGGQSKRH